MKMIFQKLLCFTRQEKGAALAELAIMVPFLILMVAAISEFGRYFQTYTSLAKSTRAAARYLSNHPFADNQDKARNLAVCGRLSCAGANPLAPGLTNANVCIQSTGTPKIERVTVSIRGLRYCLQFPATLRHRSAAQYQLHVQAGYSSEHDDVLRGGIRVRRVHSAYARQQLPR